jgi:osmoprotectant transport system ATP-binding protein
LLVGSPRGRPFAPQPALGEIEPGRFGDSSGRSSLRAVGGASGQSETESGARVRPALELRGLSKLYGTVRALDNVDLRIARGETTVLIGASGCGKSTLLRTLLRLVPPDSGIVLFEGTELPDTNVLALRRRMGYVIQEGGLFPHLTVRRNVSLVAKYLRWTLEGVESRLTELCELVQLPAELLDRYPLQLSGGQRQRVGLMRALMLDPEVLLLDEPLGALDPMIRADLQQDLRRIFRTLGKTVVLVTHDLGEAVFFANRLVLLRDGKIVQQGSFAELVRNPADPYVERFVRAQRSPFEEMEGSLA